ncbi:hypothetical protein GCM10020229_66920 [Kitasatospora albolonga]
MSSPATFRALASASTNASSPGEAALSASSSTPLTTTSGANPACRNNPNRAGDCDANTTTR